ncbi:tryptophan--tRNA ligase [Haloarchaeobius iranensis]|uniref:Tryptophan--tRNA ligase n=1 Tax=Haloarchaeobius iranensis TaxID=996166 RepID=A0A1G9SBE9_9EURY|nr:tryptophan--tRNA ligase [Haloarchaeobius iranensis]SDM32823.1 tryptophanyl-tRNA synthetase [Haloarchaeobius iranensis]
MTTDDTTTAAQHTTDDTNVADDAGDDFTVTPYDVSGTVDYDRLLERFGADRLTDEQVARFPDHPMLRRRIYYAGRSVDRFLDAAEAGETHSIVTGVGPSGPMHLGHALVFYLAKELQDATGAEVLIPLSDDEKYYAKDLTYEEISTYRDENLRDLLAVGFDPEKTTIVVDTEDAEVMYPVASAFARHLTQSTVDATYGEPENVGLSFYPAMQAAHLLLPQLVHGEHPTLVPVAVDQDPHVRVCRDVAAKERFPVSKPGALLGRFLPTLDGPGKMSASDDVPAIALTDDPDDVRETIRKHAFTGGRASVAEHREHGGDPSVDVPFQYLRFFFERGDDDLARIETAYREGELLSGELKELAADRIGEFLTAHQRRRAALGDLESALAPYRLTDAERERARQAVGLRR